MIDPIRVEPFSLGGALAPDAGKTKSAGEPGSFAQILKDSMMRVNDLQVQSDEMVNRLALGEVEDISEVSIAVEKAELAFRMLVQVRDKMLDAYQQLSRMTS